jgi:hypothetical protein
VLYARALLAEARGQETARREYLDRLAEVRREWEAAGAVADVLTELVFEEMPAPPEE